MKRSILIILFISLGLNSFSQKWEASWESLEQRPYPQWFKDAKLGIFIHWGIYSVPAYGCKECYGEWFLRGLQLNDTMRVNFMKQQYGETFSYRDFAPLFKAELFNPTEWAELFKKSGAGYVLLVSKHHDGYALWPSKYAPNWNSVDVGPRRDIVGELSTAVKSTGLKMGLYYSLPEWNNEIYQWETDPIENIKPYVEKHMIPQFKELVDTYRPELIFSDGDWATTAENWHSAELISWYYNLVGPTAIVNNRWGGGSQSIGFLTPEYSAGMTETDRPWAECRGLGRSFGLNRFEKLDAYMSPSELIHFFIKTVGNGGGITLNIGPQADGQIPLLQQERLLQLGKWISVNKDAIYGADSYFKRGEFRPISVSRVDSEINFNWVRNTPVEPISEDHFEVTWTGFIQPSKTSQYQFQMNANDEAELYLEDQLIYSTSEKSATFPALQLEKNHYYKIKILYKEMEQDAAIELQWKNSDGSFEGISKNHLFTEEGGAIHGLQGEYSSEYQYLSYTQRKGNLYAISLEWPGDQLILSIAKPSKNVQIKLLGTDKILKWTYKNNQVIIDTSTIGINDLPCEYAWTFVLENFTKEK